MKRLFLFCLGLLPLCLEAQDASMIPQPIAWTNLPLFIAEMPDEGKLYAQNQLANILTKLHDKRTTYQSAERKFLRYVFDYVHRRLLLHYAPTHPTLGDVMQQGAYDCVSGSAVYALILHELGWRYEIRETPFHVYLRVYLADGTYWLFESTNPIDGCIEEASKIAEAEHIYAHGTQEAEVQYAFNHAISLRQLAGLQYYNQAVRQFNAKQYTQATHILRKATRLYAEERIKALLVLSQEYAQE